MARKTIFVLVLCILALSCVYAGKSSIVIQGSPFSFQSVSISSGDYYSTYGYGARAGYRYGVSNNFSVGGDFDLSIFKFNELENNYMIMALRAVLGYRFDISSIIYAKCELGAGVAVRSIGDKRQAVADLQADIDAGFRISDSFAITVGLGLELGFQEKKSASSTDFAVKTEVGLDISL